MEPDHSLEFSRASSALMRTPGTPAASAVSSTGACRVGKESPAARRRQALGTVLSISVEGPGENVCSVVDSRDLPQLPIRNARWPSRSFQTPRLQKNADELVDVFFRFYDVPQDESHAHH
jgi:hypothetical protein